MIGDIVFLSEKQAIAYRSLRPTIGISIFNSDAEPPKLNHTRYAGLIRLQFDDSSEETLGIDGIPDLVNGWQNGRRIILNGNELCDFNDARKIFTFLQHHANQETKVDLMVHCEAGISRSAAVAQFAALQFGGTVMNTNRDTSGANKRLLRLLNKVANIDGPFIGDLPEGCLPMTKHRAQSSFGGVF